MSETADYPKSTNLPTPPDIRRDVTRMASEQGLSFKSMCLVLLRQAIEASKKRR